MKAESIEERVANHLRPPERVTFFDELWLRAEADARQRAKRWRAVAIGVAALAVAAVGAAAVLAARSGADLAGAQKTVDKTIVCGVTADIGSGLRVVANIDETNFPAAVVVIPAGGVHLSGIGVLAVASRQWPDRLPNGTTANMKGGYGFDQTVCQPTARIPLASAGLPKLGVFSHATTDRVSLFCPYASAPMLVRMRVTVKDGVPKAAQLAVRAGLHRRPLAFIDWTPTRFTAYGSNGCLPG